jgi:Ca-activated chloride channel family protein
MRFAAPYGIYCFLIVAALIVSYWLSLKKHKQLLERFAQAGLLPELLRGVNVKRKRLKILMLILGVSLALVSLMRPQWGFHWQEVKRKGVDIVIALDTSKSMLTRDIKPSRLARSKLAIGDFIRNLKSDRVGLVAFAGSSFLECPLTIDYGGFLLALDSIDTETIPKGGTSLTTAVREAISCYKGGSGKDKVLIIITDGEELESESSVLKAAEEARKEGILIFCVGIGSQDGELIALTVNGKTEFLKDQAGNVVKSRLNEALLQKIALATGGSYVRAGATEFGLDALYRQRISKLEKVEFQDKLTKRYDERFQIPLALALALFLLEPLISEKK